MKKKKKYFAFNMHLHMTLFYAIMRGFNEYCIDEIEIGAFFFELELLQEKSASCRLRRFSSTENNNQGERSAKQYTIAVTV